MCSMFLERHSPFHAAVWVYSKITSQIQVEWIDNSLAVFCESTQHAFPVQFFIFSFSAPTPPAVASWTYHHKATSRVMNICRTRKRWRIRQRIFVCSEFSTVSRRKTTHAKKYPVSVPQHCTGRSRNPIFLPRLRWDSYFNHEIFLARFIYPSRKSGTKERNKFGTTIPSARLLFNCVWECSITALPPRRSNMKSAVQTLFVSCPQPKLSTPPAGRMSSIPECAQSEFQVRFPFSRAFASPQ